MEDCSIAGQWCLAAGHTVVIGPTSAIPAQVAGHSGGMLGGLLMITIMSRMGFGFGQNTC